MTEVADDVERGGARPVPFTVADRREVRGFFAGVGLLVGFSFLVFLVWLVALLVLAGLIFLGLTVATGWNLGARVGASFVCANLTMKLLRIVAETLDLIPESWIDGSKKSKPCPNCGKDLRTALAQQCMHCGADWHS